MALITLAYEAFRVTQPGAWAGVELLLRGKLSAAIIEEVSRIASVGGDIESLRHLWRAPECEVSMADLIEIRAELIANYRDVDPVMSSQMMAILDRAEELFEEGQQLDILDRKGDPKTLQQRIAARVANLDKWSALGDDIEDLKAQAEGRDRSLTSEKASLGSGAWSVAQCEPCWNPLSHCYWTGGYCQGD